MAGIALPALGGGEAACRDLDLLRPMPEFRIRIMRRFALRLVGDQKLHHHFLRGDGAGAGGFNFHADTRRALARGGEHALALDLDHAGAAIAVRAIIRFGRIAQMRDLAALPLCHLPDGLPGCRLDQLAVEFELDYFRTCAFTADRADWLGMRNVGGAIGHRLAAGLALGVVAVALRLGAVVAHVETSPPFAGADKTCMLVIPRLPSAQIPQGSI